MWYRVDEQTITLFVYAKPNAKKSQFVACTEEAIQIRLHAKPHKGEANIELVSFLSEFFSVSKSLIELEKGATNRRKKIILPNTLNSIKRLQELILDFE